MTVGHGKGTARRLVVGLSRAERACLRCDLPECLFASQMKAQYCRRQGREVCRYWRVRWGLEKGGV